MDWVGILGQTIPAGHAYYSLCHPSLLQWDAFSMPELHNFLRILQREEEEHLRQILQKYSYCRQKIQEALHACPLG